LDTSLERVSIHERGLSDTLYPCVSSFPAPLDIQHNREERERVNSEHAVKVKLFIFIKDTPILCEKAEARE
jgi:hypothetical protein